MPPSTGGLSGQVGLSLVLLQLGAIRSGENLRWSLQPGPRQPLDRGPTSPEQTLAGAQALQDKPSSLGCHWPRAVSMTLLTLLGHALRTSHAPSCSPADVPLQELLTHVCTHT